MKESAAYKAGYDCGFTAANTTNCHFSFFSSPESTGEWQAGYRKGGEDRNLGRPRACQMQEDDDE